MKAMKLIVPILFGLFAIFIIQPSNVAAGDEIGSSSATQTVPYEDYLVELPNYGQVLEVKVEKNQRTKRETLEMRRVEIKMVYGLSEKIPRTMPATVSYKNNRWLRGTLTIESQIVYNGKWHVLYSGIVSG